MKDYMVETMGFVGDSFARFITWPGQATGYTIGQLKISELRDRAKRQLGKCARSGLVKELGPELKLFFLIISGRRFSYPDFHEVVLNNFGTLSRLEVAVDKFILKMRVEED